MATSSNPSPKLQAPNASSPQQAQQRQQFMPYQPPTTPEEIARELERINLLLSINTELITHLNSMQEHGQGGVLPGLAGQTSDKPASTEYVACLRATQANVAYLAFAVQGGAVPGGAASAPNRGRGMFGPVIMETPTSTPSLSSKYEQLRTLFPGWRGSNTARQPSGSGAGQAQQSHAQATAPATTTAPGYSQPQNTQSQMQQQYMTQQNQLQSQMQMQVPPGS